MIKFCKIHKNTKHKQYPSQGNRWRCLKCQSEAVTKRRKKVKEMAVEYLGGKCRDCGYKGHPSVFDFHHKDPKQKDFAISGKGCTRSFDKIKIELDKCDLLCANCHRLKHVKI